MLLKAASVLMEEAGRCDLLRTVRRGFKPLTIRGRKLELQDQDPLHEGKMLLEGGWTFPDVVEAINRRVFFWPGLASGPIPMGRNHYQRYKAQKPVMIRMKLND